MTLLILIWTFLLVLVGLWIPAAARRGERPRYRTAYACEGSQLHISCEESHLIHLIRANYGRFSISICNEHGTLDWSVDCMSHRSFRVMQESCGLKKSCSLPASSTEFGDPCPGTLKYLEAHYQCVPEATTTTTRQPPPPIIFPPNFHLPGHNATASSSTVLNTMASKITTSTSTTTTPPAPPPVHHPEAPPFLLASTTSTTVAPKSDEPEVWQSTESSSAKTSSTTEVPHSSTPWNAREDSCAPVSSRGIFWNWTKGGDMAVQRCPGGATGMAKWFCSPSPVGWTPSHPDLSGCSSLWIANFNERIHGGESVVNLAGELAMMTRVKRLYGGDIVQSASIVQQLISKMEDRVEEFPDNKQRQQVVEELLQSVVDVSSNLLEDPQTDSWKDLPNIEQKLIASTLLRGLEQNALLLADTQSKGDRFSHAPNNILVSVRVIELHAVSDLTLPTPEEVGGTPWTRIEDSLFLPSQALLENARDGGVKVIFLVYNKLEEFLDPEPQINYNPTYTDDGSISNDENVTQIINSRIITASLGRYRGIRLSEPAVLTFKHIQEENVSNPNCVFWDFNNKEWSSHGCWVRKSNRTHTVCACSHLTNFAVLMDVRAIKLSYAHEVALRVITYVGCVISIICLVLTFLTFQLFRGLKSDRTTIHKNLCLCLLTAEIIFVAGIDQTHIQILCGVVAGFLQFFFLAAFAWMFLEGFQLYVMLVEVFESEKSRLQWYYSLAYGIPALIVGISAVIDPYSYGTPRYCWLRADNYFIFSFVAPVIAILLANMVFLTIAIYMMCRHANLSTGIKTKEQTKLTSISDEDSCLQHRLHIMIWLRGAMVLVFLLGLTWAFGLLYLNEESVMMAYVFTIFNSLQGLFIFVFHCIRNEKVQKEYQKLIQRTQWLPECVRKTKDHRSSFYVHSNGTSAPQSSGQHSTSNSSQMQKDKSSTSSSSFLKSTTPVLQSTAAPERPAHERLSTRNCSTLLIKHEPEKWHSSKSLNKKSCHSDYGGVEGDLSAADCSVIDSECLSEYCMEKQSADNHKLQQQQEKLPPPYGHLTEAAGNCNTFVDHIYETIDDDPVIFNTCVHWLPSLQQVPCLEGHVRNPSTCSHQSFTTFACDQRPLLPPSLPYRNAMNTMPHILSVVPKHSSLPTTRDLLRHQVVGFYPTLDVSDGERPAGSLPEMVGQTPCVLPVSQVIPRTNEMHLHSMPNIHSVEGVRCPTVVTLDSVRSPSDNVVVMAVLDGKRVVSKIQPEGLGNVSRGHPCHKLSRHQLSTDC